MGGGLAAGAGEEECDREEVGCRAEGALSSSEESNNSAQNS